MVRQGRYSKKLSRMTLIKRDLRRRWRWFSGLSKKKKALLIATPVLAFLILVPLFTYLYYFNDIANKEHLMNRNNTGVVLTDKNGKVFYEIGRAEHRDLVPLDKISDHVEHALVASEDKTFYEHEGFSITGILRALYNNVMAQDITGGGSTITQQLAKNALLSNKQTFLRKYQELAISVAIEQRYTKDEILEMYLNSAFFGGSAFGIKEAADMYFGKTPAELDLAESAMLIGILPAPNAYSPTLGNPEYAKERQNTVLTRMVENNYITEAEKDAALKEKLDYAPAKKDEDGKAPHFTQMVLDELYAKYGGEEKVLRSGYQVKTTLDLTLQQHLIDNIAAHISYIEANGGSNASGVAIDPNTGEVRALVGSADWENPKWGKVNMATSPRQPGSSFKPIYYSRALADGVITPATVLEDVPTNFNGYTPQNASRTFSGDVTVRNALAHSLNIPSVKVMKRLGIDKAVEQAQKMGIDTIKDDKNYGLSLALGSAEAKLIDMTSAYSAFANQGEQFDTTIISEIKDKYGEDIFKSHVKSERVISEQGAFLISSILSDNAARAPIFGSSLTVPGHTAAVKTGTTDDSRDAWTIGYTPGLAVGVWVGNNDNAPMLNGGSSMAGPIWVDTMAEALRGRDNAQFPVPQGVVQRAVCYGGGLAPRGGYGTYSEYFLAWNLPNKTCTPEKSPEQLEKERKQKEEEQRKKEEEQKKDDQQNKDDTTNPDDGDNGDSGDDTTPPTDNDTDPGDGDNGGGNDDSDPIIPDPANP